jgi:hypothetical protein
MCCTSGIRLVFEQEWCISLIEFGFNGCVDIKLSDSTEVLDDVRTSSSDVDFWIDSIAERSAQNDSCQAKLLEISICILSELGLLKNIFDTYRTLYTMVRS